MEVLSDSAFGKGIATTAEKKMDHAADAHRTDLMTITRFVLNEQSKRPESRGDFTILLNHIVLGCKFVCSAVNKVSLFVIVSFSSKIILNAKFVLGMKVFESLS